MAEALGAVAAAAQLTSSCLSLFELLQRSLRAESILQGYLVHVKELYSISESIQLNPSLQTHQVEDCTKAIIKTITESKIVTTLKKKKKNRVLRACTLAFKQRELTEFLQSLESKKSILVLCIANKQSLVLHEIHTDIGRAFNRSSNAGSTSSIPSLTTIANQSKTPSMPLPSTRREPQREVHTGREIHTEKAGDNALWEGQKYYSNSGRQILGAVVKNPNQGAALEEVMANHVYKDNTMKKENSGVEVVKTASDQHNNEARREQVCGVVFEGQGIPERFAGEWKNNVFEGDGDQIMGLII